jgi:hypothetical protein
MMIRMFKELKEDIHLNRFIKSDEIKATIVSQKG